MRRRHPRADEPQRRAEAGLCPGERGALLRRAGLGGAIPDGGAGAVRARRQRRRERHDLVRRAAREAAGRVRRGVVVRDGRLHRARRRPALPAWLHLARHDHQQPDGDEPGRRRRVGARDGAHLRRQHLAHLELAGRALRLRGGAGPPPLRPQLHLGRGRGAAVHRPGHLAPVCRRLPADPGETRRGQPRRRAGAGLGRGGTQTSARAAARWQCFRLPPVCFRSNIQTHRPLGGTQPDARGTRSHHSHLRRRHGRRVGKGAGATADPGLVQRQAGGRARRRAPVTQLQLQRHRHASPGPHGLRLPAAHRALPRAPRAAGPRLPRPAL
mmetsp:Transcript_30387/g.98144  ORF Transcript_30387/g.98144 Transcript_30387/m.98144 type:complete len:327 (-) Transcript_30387:1983-2963(-)